MGMSLAPVSPKYGYGFDGQEHDVRKARKARPCQGGRVTRGSTCPASSPRAAPSRSIPVTSTWPRSWTCSSPRALHVSRAGSQSAPSNGRTDEPS